MSPEAEAYAARAQRATEEAQERRERQVEAGRIETALTIAAATAMFPHIVLAFRDTPAKQRERRMELLEATYGSREDAA